MFSQLRDLRVFLFFLDDNSRVLEASMIARSLTPQIDEKLQFSKFFKVPQGSVRISFGYDGKVSENEDIESFYLLPLNNWRVLSKKQNNHNFVSLFEAIKL